MKLKPTPVQHQALLRCFRDARKTYNQTIHHILSTNQLSSPAAKIEKESVYEFVSAFRVLCRGSKSAVVLRTPKVIRQQAVKEAVSHVRGYQTLQKKRMHLRENYPGALKFKSDVQFNPRYKSRTMTTDSISIEKCSFKFVDSRHFTLFPNMKSTNLLAFAMKRNKNSTVEYTKQNQETGVLFQNMETCGDVDESSFNTCDLKVHYKNGDFYIIIPKRVNVTKLRPTKRECVGAVDPGIRTLATVYSPEGSVLQIGTNANKVALKCIRRIEKAKWRLVDFKKKMKFLKKPSKSIRNTLWRLKKQFHDAHQKASNVARNAHYKIAHLLCGRYETIIYPDFNTHTIVGRKNRSISKQVVKYAQFWRHGKLKERLVQVSTYYGSTVKTGSEAYTTMTCGRCGNINKIGSSDTYRCKVCNLCIGRDVNGARNILLKFLEK